MSYFQSTRVEKVEDPSGKGDYEFYRTRYMIFKSWKRREVIRLLLPRMERTSRKKLKDDDGVTKWRPVTTEEKRDVTGEEIRRSDCGCVRNDFQSPFSSFYSCTKFCL